ncbi:hypothetical protein H2248_003736 [Termitomyces sp. 'cryptogamus']|nr:hypothetical protein H2248_003736 [Termitomyces sp. 'cryptogamus']
MAEGSLRALLHSSEHLRVLLEAQLIQPPSSNSRTVVEESICASDSGNARVLAIIAHKDDRYASEEGSLFVCTSTSQDDTTPEIKVENVFPLISGFSISLAQIKQSISEARTHDDENDTGFSLTIYPGKSLYSGLESNSVSFFARDMKALRLFMEECRGLTKTEENLMMSRLDSEFLWLLPYTSDRELSNLFEFVPQDLRLIDQPLQTRLSPSLAGSPDDDIADFRLMRDVWIPTQARETSLNSQYRLKIRIGTFNVNGKLPSQDLSSWILSQASTSSANVFSNSLSKNISPTAASGLAKKSIDSPFKVVDPTTRIHDTSGQMSNLANTDPDLLVLGFQELDLSTEALIYSSATAREDAWCRAVFAALGEKMELYEKLVSRQHVGLLIVVIAKKTLISCFSNVQTSIASTGIMGIMGNKGGSAVRLTFTPPISNSVDVISPGPTILTFVNSHLAAFDEMAEKRNSDFQEISKKLKFAPPLSDRAGTVPVHMSVYESDVLFWMVSEIRLLFYCFQSLLLGWYVPLTARLRYSESKHVDLNYRIDLHNEEVRGILASDKSPGRLETLLRYDQLKKASRSKKAFYGFLEHPITHLPTYRFSPGIETDALGYDTKRKPAWTDRILHMAGRNASVRQFSYTCHPQITMSDHKPVAADFSLDVDVYDQNSYSDIYRKLFKSLARMEDYPNRVIKLDTTSVDMGFVSYKRSTSQKLNLTNSGQSPCAYRFVPHAPDTAAHPEWLYIEPMQAILLPGESLQVTITSHVDNEIACKLNLGQKDLRTTLILHTILGKDHFISVAAEYQRTCFATKLSWLTRLPGPVRSLNSLHDLRPEDQPINAPSEIMRLVNWMMSGHVDDGMFTLPGDESVIDTIRECLETGDEFPFLQADTDLTVMLSFGETLLRLLDSLVDPVVPIFLHSQCTQMKNRDEAFELLETFPPVSVNVWISLTALLHFLCQSDNQPSEKAERIATIFTPILLRDEPDSDLPSVSLLGKRKFLLYFIA